MKLHSTMTRREFLKSLGLAAGTLFAAPFISAAGSPPPKKLPASNGSSQSRAQVQFRGTDDGKVLKSEDRGASWQTLVNFGASYQIQNVMQSSNILLAQVSFEGARFVLRSMDGRVWYTT